MCQKNDASFLILSFLQAETVDYEKYMRRALELAGKGEGFVSPNPMVGAVIVSPQGRIIGEGWHRRFGEAHAEVNAIRSVASDDIPLLKDSTIFVTLEPCAHYGKTPPCADLLIEKKIGKAVIATTDPFSKVNGEGMRRLHRAGVEVKTGILEKEAVELNRKFFFAHSERRPYVTLKWAQSVDGWMDSKSGHPFRFSNETTSYIAHKLRASNDAVITSTSTATADNPRLDIRFLQSGRCPVPVVIGNTQLNGRLNLSCNPRTIYFKTRDLKTILQGLYHEYGFISVLVEAGNRLLTSFIEQNLWNEAHVEVSPVRLDSDGCIASPFIKSQPVESFGITGNNIFIYKNG